jgi:hypothetical protein
VMGTSLPTLQVPMELETHEDPAILHLPLKLVKKCETIRKA